MAGPWEKYGLPSSPAPAPQAGPWARYAAPAPPQPNSPAQAAPEPRPSVFRMDSDFRDAAPNVGVGDMTWAAAKDMFGSRKSAAEYLAKEAGGTVVQGEDGEPQIRLPDGTVYRTNDPGIDSADVANVTGNVAAFWTPAAWAARLSQGRNAGLAVRAGTQAATAGAADLGLQTAVQGGDVGQVDPVRTAGAVVGGGAGEAVGTAASTLFRKVAPLFRSDVSSQAAAKALADEAGATNLTPAQMTGLAKGVEEIKAGADPETVLAKQEFGFLYTQGQRLAEGPAKFGVLSREELLRQQPGSGEVFREAQRKNVDTLDEVLDTIGKRQGAPAGARPAELAQGAATRLREQAEGLQGRISDAYRVAGQNNRTAVTAESVGQLPKRLAAVVRDFDPNPVTTPITAKTLQQIKASADSILTGAPGSNVGGVTLRALETQRRILLNNINATGMNKADRAAMQGIKREFDNWLDDAVESSLVSGDPQALAAIKEARGLRAEYGRRFEGGADSDKFIAGLLDGSRTPEELVNIALGSSQVSKSGGARFIERLRVAADGDPQVIGPLRSAHFMRLTRGADGKPLQMGQITRNIRTTEYNNGSILKALYSPEEWTEIRRLAGALEPLIAKGDFAKSSGTAERMARMLAQKIGGGLPFVGDTVQAVMTGRNVIKANDALQAPLRLPTRTPAGVPALGAATMADRSSD